MAETDYQELQDSIQDIAQFAPKLNSPFDRVRVAEWIRRLAQEAHGGGTANANQYAQLLRIQSQEVLSRVPSLPTPGPLAPFMCHKSPDGTAYVAARKIPGKGVLCYLAVSPDGLQD